MQHHIPFNSTPPQSTFNSNQTAIPYIVSQDYLSAIPAGTANPAPSGGRASTPSPSPTAAKSRASHHTTAISSTEVSSHTVNWDAAKNRERMLRLILSVSAGGEGIEAQTFVEGYKRHQAFRNGAHEMVIYLLRQGKGKKADEVSREVDRERIAVLKRLIVRAGGKPELERLLRDEEDLGKGKKGDKGGGRGRGQMDFREVRQRLGR